MLAFMHKSDSRRELDTAFTGETHCKTLLFSSFSSHTSVVNKKLFLQQLICKRKLKTVLQALEARIPLESIKHQKKYWGACIQHPAHKKKEKKNH